MQRSAPIASDIRLSLYSQDNPASQSSVGGSRSQPAPPWPACLRCATRIQEYSCPVLSCPESDWVGSALHAATNPLC